MTEFTGSAARLTQRDLADAAESLGCELAVIRSVIDVEAGKGGGFLPDTRPKILFESRWFHKLTGGCYDNTHPDISTPTWVRNYVGGAGEYRRLGKAIELDRAAALKSTSWGLFQILGVNHEAAGFDDVESFVAAQVDSEGEHLKAFVNFVKHKRLDDELRERRWADFAKVYNGPGYKRNRYDQKLAAAYKKYADTSHRQTDDVAFTDPAE